MTKPKITLTINSNHQTVSFHVEHISTGDFYQLLHRFKQLFLARHWNESSRTWELPLSQIQAMYEFCKNAVGAEGVNIEYEDHNTQEQPRQLRLFS